MRISNIQHYLGGADQVIAREVLEGNQFILNIDTGDNTIDFSSASTTFSVKTELFNSTITESRGSIKINSLTEAPGAFKGNYPKADVIKNAANGTFDLLIKSNLLDLVSVSADPAVQVVPNSESPYIVIMKCQWTSGDITKSLRFLFIMRYQPQ
jgi:hypothetical protein